MKTDKLLRELLSVSMLEFVRRPLWEQVKFLDKVLDKWTALKRVSPYQSFKWQAKFWDLTRYFCGCLSNDLHYIEDKWLSSKTSRHPPNFARFLNRIHEFDEASTHKLMLVHPRAFTVVKDEWANWVGMVM